MIFDVLSQSFHSLNDIFEQKKNARCARAIPESLAKVLVLCFQKIISDARILNVKFQNNEISTMQFPTNHLKSFRAQT
jgi:hypothetical protein